MLQMQMQVPGVALLQQSIKRKIQLGVELPTRANQRPVTTCGLNSVETNEKLDLKNLWTA